MAAKHFVTAEYAPEYEPGQTIRSVATRKPRGPAHNGGFLMAMYKPNPNLPQQFMLPVRDDSMEPMLSTGDLAIFSKTVAPETGDCILVGTEFGPDIRQYESLTDGQWRGAALHPEYEDIYSAEECIWIAAVLVGIERAPKTSGDQRTA